MSRMLSAAKSLSQYRQSEMCKSRPLLVGSYLEITPMKKKKKMHRMITLKSFAFARGRSSLVPAIPLFNFACFKTEDAFLYSHFVFFVFSGKKGKKSITNWPQADSSCVLYCEDCDRPCYLSAVSTHQHLCLLHCVMRLATCRCSPRSKNKCRQSVRPTRETRPDHNTGNSMPYPLR